MEGRADRFMKQRIFTLGFLILFLMVGGFTSMTAAAAKTPTQAIKELDKMAEQYRVGDLSLADKLFNRQLKKKMLHGTFDLRELASLALDDQWTKLSNRERKRFVQLLTSLLEERSVFAKERAE